MKSKDKSLEKKIDVHYCTCGHPATFHNYLECIGGTIDTRCDHCDCKEYQFGKIIKKKRGDCLGYYNGEWMTFYEIRKIEENKG